MGILCIKYVTASPRSTPRSSSPQGPAVVGFPAPYPYSSPTPFQSSTVTMARGSNRALQLNPPNADLHISTHASDWLWSAFSVFALSMLVMVVLDFLVSYICSGNRVYGPHVCLSVRGVLVSSINLRLSSWPRSLSVTTLWRLISVLLRSMLSSAATATIPLARFG